MRKKCRRVDTESFHNQFSKVQHLYARCLGSQCLRSCWDIRFRKFLMNMRSHWHLDLKFPWFSKFMEKPLMKILFWPKKKCPYHPSKIQAPHYTKDETLWSTPISFSRIKQWSIEIAKRKKVFVLIKTVPSKMENSDFNCFFEKSWFFLSWDC